MNSPPKKDGDAQVLADRMMRRLMKGESLSGFTDEQFFTILAVSKRLLTPLPCMVEMTAPVVIFGDTHGQFFDLLRFFRSVGTPPLTKLLFLGDYIDRGSMSLEIITLLLCFKIRFPKHIELLRGNHETMKMNRSYGFYAEMKRKRTVGMWKEFQEVFNELPLCALVSKRILAMHGGISPHIESWDTLKNLTKPKTQSECDSGIQQDLMWSDPSADTCGFQINRARAASYIFGDDSIRQFCATMKIDMIVRAHEMVLKGHQMMSDDLLCTVFSAPNYCGVDKNCGSVMRVSRDLEVSFETLRPRLDIRHLPEHKLRLLRRMSTVDSAGKSPNPQPKRTGTSEASPKNMNPTTPNLGGNADKPVEKSSADNKESEKTEGVPPSVAPLTSQAPPLSQPSPVSEAKPRPMSEGSLLSKPSFNTEATPTAQAPHFSVPEATPTSPARPLAPSPTGSEATPTRQVVPPIQSPTVCQSPPAPEAVVQAPPTSDPASGSDKPFIKGAIETNL